MADGKERPIRRIIVPACRSALARDGHGQPGRARGAGIPAVLGHPAGRTRIALAHRLIDHFRRISASVMEAERRTS